jgi:hypothetical protein
MNLRHPFLAVLFAVGVSGAAVIGCDSDSGGNSSKTRKTSRTSDDQVISSGSGSHGDARGMDSIPSRANRVAEGKDQRMIYTAPEDGTLYVYDTKDRKLLFSGPLYRNEEFQMVPDGNVINVNGRRAGTYNLHTDRRYELYFDRDSGQRDSRSSNRF